MINTQALQRYAPSVFTIGNASHTVSDKYCQIPTIQIIEELDSKGFEVVKAMQANTRIPGNKAFVKHMLRFRHTDSKPDANGLFPELVLVNSHDGKSSYRLMAGVYRLVCMNGLIAGSTSADVRIRHSGDILGNVVDATYEVINEANKMIIASNELTQIALTTDERMAFAEAALSLKFDETTQLTTEFNTVSFLRGRNRYDTEHTDLFTTFNVLQENLMKGGLRTYKLNDNGQRIARTRTREVKSIDENIKLNRALWALTTKMALLKAA